MLSSKFQVISLRHFFVWPTRRKAWVWLRPAWPIALGFLPLVLLTATTLAQAALPVTPLPPAAVPVLALTLDQALWLAQRHSRQMAAQEALALAARQMSVAAGQLPDPTLKFGLNNLPVTGADSFNLTSDFMTMQSVGVMRELTRSDKRAARTTRFEREAEVADANRAMAQVNLQRDTALAWLERHFQERMAELLRQGRAEASLQIEAAEAAYRGGRGAQMDVFAARAAVAQMDDRIRQAEQQILMAKTRLVRWVGHEGNQALAPPPDLGAVKMAMDTLDERVKDHPQVAVLNRQEALALAEAAMAQSEKKPDWTLELMFNQRGPAFSNMVSLNFSLPLQTNQGRRQDRDLAAKLALVGQLQAQREETLRERVGEARAWLQQWQGNRQRLEAYDSTLIPLGAQRTQAALAAYRGSGTLLAVLEARRMEIDIRMDRLRLEMETAGLWAQLNHLTLDGHDLPVAPNPASALEK